VNIYHLTAKKYGGYDSYNGFVIVARTEAEARGLINKCGEECRHQSKEDPEEECFWKDSDRSDCELIGTANSGAEPRIVEESFTAG
jgi:hypothetical protein